MNCRFCDCALTPVLDMGRHALPGQFLAPEELGSEPLLPLKLAFCEGCYALQLEHEVEPSSLFADYFYHSSSIPALRQHAERLAGRLIQRFSPNSVLEIGCNDGVLLKHFAGIPLVAGVDPAPVVRSVHAPFIGVQAYFTEQLARELGRFDLIVANNVMAHIPDIRDATRGVKAALAEDGVFVMEVHALKDMLAGVQYDWIYHEHRYYYSLLTLVQHFSRHDLVAFDVEPVDMHGGSMRVYVCRAGAREVSRRVTDWLDAEMAAGLSGIEVFRAFAAEAASRRDALRETVQRLAMQGRMIAGYGASGRANTILQWAGLTRDEIEFIADDAPAKQGRYTPGTHIPIASSRVLDSMRPDYVLVLAWPYLEAIKPKCGERPLILPLPEVRVTDRAKEAA